VLRVLALLEHKFSIKLLSSAKLVAMSSVALLRFDFLVAYVDDGLASWDY